VTLRFSNSIPRDAGVGESAIEPSFMEVSFVHGSPNLSAILDTLGYRRCPGCKSLIPKNDPDHSPEECVVSEVMSS